MTELHGKKWGAQHPGTDRSVEGGVYGAVTALRFGYAVAEHGGFLYETRMPAVHGAG